MDEKVELLKEINTKRGNNPSQINIAMDGRYNSVTIANHKSQARMHHKLLVLHVRP